MSSTTTTTKRQQQLMDFDMSIDLTAALADDHLDDPDVSAAVKTKKQQNRRPPALTGRPGLSRAPSARSRRHLLKAGVGGGVGAAGRRMSKIGWASKLHSIGEQGSSSRIGMSFDDSFVALPEFRQLSARSMRLGLDAGAAADEEGSFSMPSSPAASASSSPSAASAGKGGTGGVGRARPSLLSAPSRRALLTRQPSIARRSSVARLVSNAASQLSELEDFLQMDDSQAIASIHTEDDMSDDGVSDNTSLRDELAGLKDFENDIEETMRRELEGLWMSGAVDGWKEDEDSGEEKKDEGDEAKVSPDDADSAAVSSLASSSFTRSSARPVPAASSMALAGGVSLARRRSSTALDLAGLEDFAADLERQWEEAVLLEETIFADDEGDDAKIQYNKDEALKLGKGRAAAGGIDEEPADNDLNLDDLKLTLGTTNMSGNSAMRRLSTIESLNGSTTSSVVSGKGSPNLRPSSGENLHAIGMMSLDEEHESETTPLPSPRPSPPLESTKAAFAADMPTLVDTISSRAPSSISRSLSDLDQLEDEKHHVMRKALTPPRREQRKTLLIRLMDAADRIAGVLYGRSELSLGRSNEAGAIAESSRQTVDSQFNTELQTEPQTKLGTRTRQGAALLHLILTASVVKILQGDMLVPRISPTPGEIFWPCAALVPAAATALLELSLPRGVEDVHVGAGLGMAVLLAERALHAGD